MKLQKLLTVLSKQENNLKKLLSIASEKKEILISNNHDELIKIVAAEEKKLLSIQETEEKRLQLIQDLFIEHNIVAERYKLSALVNNLKDTADQTLLNQVSESELRMRNVIEKITKMNHLNMVLIQQSRALMNETIQAVINSSSKSILDRKG